MYVSFECVGQSLVRVYKTELLTVLPTVAYPIWLLPQVGTVGIEPTSALHTSRLQRGGLAYAQHPHFKLYHSIKKALRIGF